MTDNKIVAVTGLVAGLIGLAISLVAFFKCTKFYDTAESWRFFASLVSVLIFVTFAFFNLLAFLFVLLNNKLSKSNHLE